MSIVGAVVVPHPPLIVPAVGRGDEVAIQNTIDAYTQAIEGLLALKPDVLVVTSPHARAFLDGFHITTDFALRGSMGQFSAPHERMDASCDAQLASEIMRAASDAHIATVGSQFYRDNMDHGTYVPLYFVREAYHAAHPEAEDALPCPIVRIGLSGLAPEVHKQLGQAIAQAADKLDRKVGFIASGDLSHKLLAEGPYGFAPEGPVFDEQIEDIFTSGELERLYEFDEDFCEAAAECGLRSFQIMAGAIDGLGFESKMLSHEGPFGVGYGVATLFPAGATEETKAAGETAAVTAGDTTGDGVDPYVALARLSVETFVSTGQPATLPDNLPSELLETQAGAFVSLHEHGQLRGCIGTISATADCVAEEILANGISACSRDPRFDPVTPDELDHLEYSVDVLGEAERILSPDDLDPVRYGAIVTQGWKRGLLLPNLDGVDTVEEQLAIAKQKAGISPLDPNVTLERFEVVRHTLGGQPRA